MNPIRTLTALSGALALAPSAHAQTALEKGFAGALKGCEQWVLEPATWADGMGPFMSAVGLGDMMGPVSKVEEANLPPKQMRRANHYWRINATAGAGYVLVVSDQIPMCHITGGGDVDLEPVVEKVLASETFANHWEKLKVETKGDMIATQFRSREDPKFWMTISRASKPAQRLDRVQVFATAMFNLK